MRPNFRKFCWLLAVAGTLAACAGAEPEFGFDRSDITPEQLAAATLLVGYQQIDNLYVRPVDLGQVAMNGINGLSELDPAISAELSDDTIAVLSDDRVILSYGTPAPGDARGWAEVTLAAIDYGRAVSPQLADADPDTLIEAVFTGVTSGLDSYSRYLPPNQASVERTLREGYGGVGMLLDLEPSGEVIIREIFQDGPAAEAGMQAGGQIVSIDGESTEAWTIEQLGEGLRGPIGTRVRVGVRNADGTLETFRLTRDQVIPTVVHVRIDDDIAVVDISRFNTAVVEQLRDTVIEVVASEGPSLRGIILDLRGNPGGLLGQSVDVADLFISRGEIIRTRGRHPRSHQEFQSDPGDIANGLPMAVLVDGRSASAAEIVAAALQDSGRAIVIGASSFGKGSVQTVTPLPNGGELFLTWSRIFAPSGFTIDQQGVLPTVCTSVGIYDADSLVSRFRDGSLPVPASLADLRQRAADDAESLRQLRAECPWRVHSAELDVMVAIDVLNDPSLYRQAVAAALTGTETSG